VALLDNIDIGKGDRSLAITAVAIVDVPWIMFRVVMRRFSDEPEVVVSIFEFSNVEEAIVDCKAEVSCTKNDVVTGLLDRSIFV
jgi:ABC-type thiamine transport system substrate-binding protein